MKWCQNCINSRLLRGDARCEGNVRGCVALSCALRVLIAKTPLSRAMARRRSENQRWRWALWAKSWALGTGSQVLTTPFGNVQPNQLDFFLRPPSAPTTEKQYWWKMPLWEFNLYEKHFIFVSKSSSLCRVFHLLFAKAIFHSFSRPKFLLKNWMLLPKMGIFSFSFTPLLHTQHPPDPWKQDNWKKAHFC